MSVETGLRIGQDEIRAGAGIYFENPLRKREDDSAIVKIVVSRERLRAIGAGMLSGYMIWRPGEPGDNSFESLTSLTAGINSINVLMPSRINFVLERVLTPRQYQRALEANRNGKLVKFSLKGRP